MVSYTEIWTVPGSSAGERFGGSLALAGDLLAVGAYNSALFGPLSGRAELLTLVGEDCNYNESNDQCDLLTGTSFDCNGNKIPDECEVVLGLLSDCDGDGLADSCALASGLAQDCNGNGIPDSCDLTSGFSLDCDGNEIPDECLTVDHTASRAASPAELATGGAFDLSLTGLPLPAGDAFLTVRTAGDLGGLTEFLDLTVGGVDHLDLFLSDGSECPETPDEWTLSLPLADLLDALVGDTLPLTALFSGAVDPAHCDAPSLSVELVYPTAVAADCNGNGTPDLCDLILGVETDLDGNGVPDDCQPDCNGNGIPDVVEILTGTTPDCNENGVPDFCDIGSGTSTDGNTDGVPDECGVDFTRGDCNSDGEVQIADAIAILGYLFDNASAPTCADSCDSNDDGGLNLGDAVYTLTYLFSSGAAPAPPFGACGDDQTPTDILGCLDFTACP